MRLIQSSNNLLPPLRSENIIYIFLGFVSVWPFYIYRNLSPVLINFNPNKISVGLDGTPIPIGIITLSIYIFILMIRTNSVIFLIKSIISYGSILALVLLNFDPLRIPILLFPIIYIVIITRLARIRYNPNDGFIFGYLSGLISLCLINIFSFLLVSFDNQSFANISYVRQIFGYEIWQFYVSYSAVISLSFGVYTIFLVKNFSILGKYKLFFLTLSILTLIVAVMPLRKAAFLDFIVVIVILIIDILPNLFRTRIKKISLITLLLLLSAFLAFNFLIFSSRGFRINDRLEALLPLFDIINNLNFVSLFWGSQKGFGGYSNLFVELFVRNGIIGFIVYITFVIFCINKYFNTLYILRGSQKSRNNNILRFIFFSVFIGNFVNLNFGVPYFVVNFACILTSFNSIDYFSRNRLLKF